MPAALYRVGLSGRASHVFTRRPVTDVNLGSKSSTSRWPDPSQVRRVRSTGPGPPRFCVHRLPSSPALEAVTCFRVPLSHSPASPGPAHRPTGPPGPGCCGAPRTCLSRLALQGALRRQVGGGQGSPPLDGPMRVVARAPHRGEPPRPDPPESPPQTQGLPTLRPGCGDIRSHLLQGPFPQEVMPPGPESAGEHTEPRTGSLVTAAS